MKLDTSGASESQGYTPVREGIYHVQVESADSGYTAAGDGRINLRLVEVGSGRHICFDMVMMTGRGSGIGESKLHGLGFDTEATEDYLDEMFLGRRAWVAIKHEVYKGEARAKVDISKGEHCGYWTEAEYNAEFPQAPTTDATAAPSGFGSDEDTPF